MADETKSLSGLLNGIARRLYYNDAEINDEFLKTQLYPNISDEDFQQLIHKSTNIVKSMASTDMDFNQLEAFLKSQTKKKEHAITEDEAKVYAKFWKNHKTKIHDSLVNQCTWNNTLKNVNWRIDIKTQARNLEQINTPTAIVELQLAKNKNSKESETVRFEMDEEKLTKVLSNLQEVEEQITAYCQQ